MTSTIITKNSETAGDAPTAATGLETGELAVNVADKKLFVGTGVGSDPVLINSGGAGSLFPNKPAGEPIVIIALGNSDIISQQVAANPMASNSKRLSWVVATQQWSTVDMSDTNPAADWTPGDFYVGYTGEVHGNLPLATGDYLSKLTGTSCYIIQAGKGGTPISQYAPNSAYETTFSGEIDTALAAIPDSNGDLGNITKADIFIFGNQAEASGYKVAKYSEQFLRLYNFWISTRGYIDLETTQVLLTEMYDGRTGSNGNPNDWKASEQTMTQTNGNVKIVSSRGLLSTDGLHISGNDLTKFGARCGQAAMQPNAPKIEVPAGSPRRVLNTVPLAGQWILDPDNDAAPASGHFGFKQNGVTLQIHKTDNGGVSAPLEWVYPGNVFSFTDESATTATMLVYTVVEQTNHWEFLTLDATSMDTLALTEECDLLGNTVIPSGKFDDYLVAPRGGRVIVGELDPTAIPISAYGAKDYKTVTARTDLVEDPVGFGIVAETGLSYSYTNDINGTSPFTFERTIKDNANFGGKISLEKHAHKLITQIGKGIPSTQGTKGAFSMEIAYDNAQEPQEAYSAVATIVVPNPDPALPDHQESEFRINSLKLNATLDLDRSPSSRALVGTTNDGGIQWEKEDEYIHYATAETTGTAAVTMYSRTVDSYGAIVDRPCLVKVDVVGHRYVEGGTTTGEYYTCTKQALISWNGTDPVLSPVTEISEIRTGATNTNAFFSIFGSKFQINVQHPSASGTEQWKWKCVVYREVLPESHSG